MLKTILASATLGVLVAFPAIAHDFICYSVTPTGQVIDLTALCHGRSTTYTNPIAVTDLSLDVLEENLSSKVKATITNLSQQPVKVGVVLLAIYRDNTPVSSVPIYVNQTLKPGQSIPASGLFDSAELQQQDLNQLTVRFQSWQ